MLGQSSNPGDQGTPLPEGQGGARHSLTHRVIVLTPSEYERLKDTFGSDVQVVKAEPLPIDRWLAMRRRL